RSGHCSSLSSLDGIFGRTQYIAHGVEPRLPPMRPKRRLDGSTGEDGAVLREMREDDALPETGKDDGVLAHDRAAAKRGKADRAFPAGAGMTVAHPNAFLRKIHATAFRSGFAQEQCRSRWCIHLVAMMHLNDLDVEIARI